MIDEMKLVERLQMCVNTSDNSNFTNGLLSAIDIVNQQAQIGGWILCSERLPESDGMYLITAKVLQKKEVQYVWFQKNEKIFVCNGIAIAWQPLPEAYHG